MGLLSKIADRFRKEPEDESIRKFCDVLAEHPEWLPEPDATGAVLIPYVNWPPAVAAYALAATTVAREFSSKLYSYSYLKGSDRKIVEAYAAFGAEPAFAWGDFEKSREEFAPLAKQLLDTVQTNRELLQLCHEGILIGDFVHDTFIRLCGEAQVPVKDPRVLGYLQDALAIKKSFESLLGRLDVRAMILADPCYIYFGIPHRIAALRGIPCFGLEYNPVALLPMDVTVGKDNRHLRENWPQKSRNWKRPKKKFFSLPLKSQKAAIRESREFLKNRLSGALDLRILGRGGTAFSAPSKERVLADTPKPKILVMMHDFLDCPNVYQWSLFPDFVEWTDFLFGEAAKTDFEWYAKAHPHLDPRITAANNAILEKVKARHPKINFISPSTSNMQLIKEGVTAMFTVHGTPSHEFAYLDIPCVNAGDNPHVEYGFNYNARSIDEYRDLIHRADSLKADVRKGEIEVCCYLRFFYPYHEVRSDFSIVPPEWFGKPNQYELESGTQIFGHVAGKLAENGKDVVDATVKHAIELEMKSRASGI